MFENVHFSYEIACQACVSREDVIAIEAKYHKSCHVRECAAQLNVSKLLVKLL